MLKQSDKKVMKIARYMYAHVAMFLITLTSVAFVMLGSYEYKAVKAVHDDALYADEVNDQMCRCAKF